MCGMVINCFDLSEGGKMLGFCVEGGPLVRRRRQAPSLRSASSICGGPSKPTELEHYLE